MNTNTKYYIFLVILVLAVGAILYFAHVFDPSPAPTVVTVIRYDTIPRVPINLDSVKATVKPRWKTVYKDVPNWITIVDTFQNHDTIRYLTPAFEACFDTITQKDTVNLGFKFPEMTFDCFIRQHPCIDTNTTTTITVTKKPTFLDNISDIGIKVAIFAGGVIIGKVIK
jgi:hypothetical protein